MSDEQEHTKAAVVFTGLLTLAAGFAGLAVAGMVLGFDYLLHGDPSERDHVAAQRAANRRARYDDALAWLEADRADRASARAARRAWFADDPATRGDAPSSGETLGRVLARVWSAMLVGGTRFARGWRTGRDQARARRDDGDATWWRRPPHTEPETSRPDTAPADDTQQPPEPPAPARPTQPEPDDAVIDAEIIPDTEPAGDRPLVPVGQDTPIAGPDVDGYAERIDDLRGEVDQTRGTRPEDPSPPLAALH